MEETWFALPNIGLVACRKRLSPSRHLVASYSYGLEYNLTKGINHALSARETNHLNGGTISNKYEQSLEKSSSK